jgi:hypothetical protein
MEATMFDANTVKQPATEPESDRFWTREQAEARMRELVASLPSQPLKELARQQGVRIPQRWQDLIPDRPEGEWDSEEDFDAIREQMRAGEIEIMRKKLAETPLTGLNPADDYETFEREHWANHIAAWKREHANTSDKDTAA